MSNSRFHSCFCRILWCWADSLGIKVGAVQSLAHVPMTDDMFAVSVDHQLVRRQVRYSVWRKGISCELIYMHEVIDTLRNLD